MAGGGLASRRFFEADHVDGQARYGLCTREYKFLQRLGTVGVKIFFTALLAHLRGNPFNDLELVSPVKIDADFSSYHFALAEIAWRGSGIIISCAFSNHLPTPFDHH